MNHYRRLPPWPLSEGPSRTYPSLRGVGGGGGGEGGTAKKRSKHKQSVLSVSKKERNFGIIFAAGHWVVQKWQENCRLVNLCRLAAASKGMGTTELTRRG